MFHRFIRRASPVALVVLTALSVGCVELEDHLTIEPDGSGVVRLRLVTSDPQARMALMIGVRTMLMGGETPASLNYPPISADQATVLFPADAFKVTTTDDAGGAVVIEARFTDVNALLASPYAMARSLAITRGDDGRLVVRATTGVRHFANFTFPEGEDAAIIPPQMKQLTEQWNKLKMTHRLTLPGDGATPDAAAAADGRTVTWSIDAAAIGDQAKVRQAAQAVMTATCPADAAKFDPAPVVRLDLSPYASLAAGATGAQAKKVDTDAVRAAAQVAPVMVQVTRSFDLTGQGFYGESGTQLTLAVTLPTEHRPQRWGQLRITEAVDDTGANLAAAADDPFDRMRYIGRSTEDLTKGERIVHPVVISLKTPAAAAKAIRSVKGEIDAFYPGAGRVIKVDNAIAKEQIADRTALPGSFNRSRESGAIKSAELAQAGLSVQVQYVMKQGGMLMIMLEAEGDGGQLGELQVFDAAGKPWPTMLAGERFGGTTQAVVFGSPEAPLSLAMVVTGGGAKVTVPVDLKNLDLTPNKPPTPADDDAPKAIDNN